MNLAAIATQSPWTEVNWGSDDALLYAIAVGAGHTDPCQEMAFTTETSLNNAQRVLPTFAAGLVYNAHCGPSVGNCDRTKGVQASQSLNFYRSLPVSGRVRIRTRVAGIYDQGWGALAVYESEAVDSESCQPMFGAVHATFFKDEGGFGGTPLPPSGWNLPTRPPDVAQAVLTRPEQALLFRLCGDRNPLHNDPEFANQCGFRRPILHGLCTYGIAGRVLLNTMCASDPVRFSSMSGRFTRRVVPGETLTVVAWEETEQCIFRVLNASGGVVLDEGRLTSMRPAGGS